MVAAPEKQVPSQALCAPVASGSPADWLLAWASLALCLVPAPTLLLTSIQTPAPTFLQHQLPALPPWVP